MDATGSTWVKAGLLALGAVAAGQVVAHLLSAPGRRKRDKAVAELKAEIEAGMDGRIRDAVREAISAAPDSSPKLYPPVKKLSRTEQKRILVTGGAGFVGSNLVDVLMMQGHIVYVMDNLFTGRKANIEHWMGHPNFAFYQHDVVNSFFIEVEQIYHLACPASPPHYQYNAIKTIKCSTMGTLNMLGLAKRVRARMLLTSTSEIYGDPEQHPQRETYWGNVNTMGPRSCYDEGKRVAETMCYSYREEGHVDVRIARIFNTFGPRMHPDDGRVVSNFIKQCLQGTPLTVFGDGSQTRSFQYVSDLVQGLICLMNGDYNNPVNIGNGEEQTILQFAEYIQRTINPDAKITFKALPHNDPTRRRPDTTVAKRELNWQPKVSTNDGLDKTIAYFQHELGLAPKDAPPPPVVWMPEMPESLKPAAGAGAASASSS